MHKYTKSTVCLLSYTDLVIQIPRQNPDSTLVVPSRVYTHCKFLSTIGSNTRALGVFLRGISPGAAVSTPSISLTSVVSSLASFVSCD